MRYLFKPFTTESFHESPAGTERHREKQISSFSFVFVLLLCVLCVSVVNPVFARQAAPLAQDEAVEKRLVDISSELRCLVCQNESLAGSHAELAVDLRREIRTMISDGKSNAEIMDFMVSRYGDFVRYRPPLKATTLLLWFGPALFLISGFVGLLAYLRRRNRAIDETPLSGEERKLAERLLDNEDGNQDTRR